MKINGILTIKTCNNLPFIRRICLQYLIGFLPNTLNNFMTYEDMYHHICDYADTKNKELMDNSTVQYWEILMVGDLSLSICQSLTYDIISGEFNSCIILVLYHSIPINDEAEHVLYFF